ncbi:MAG: HDOD domain-containing protein [Syntrophomonadaceae bacterium]|nr:HDOD domain-containing protein [Syntrophomonadaceae bacterium]MDD3888542.1 HDOD domain-containing protein [Syntrophomonadaceae bacterium]MDD4548615.1 HDOD domain-containing protein [Syntrophomonadaceae bacterium]
MGKVTMESIVEAVNDLPSLPHIVTRVIELSEDPDSTATDINNVLSQDQGMTAKVLRLANSAFYGFPRRIGTVTDATILLGFKTIRSIVMAASVSDILSQEMQGYVLTNGELWKHSQASALAARLIGKKVKYRNLDLAYTGALLHDIGKVILNNSMIEAYHEVIERVNQGDIPFIEAENLILGFNHAMVGAKVAEKWNLPTELVETIELHHDPIKSVINRELTSIVHLADAVCVSMGIGIGIDGLLYPISAGAVRLLGLNEFDIDCIISDLADFFSDQQSF